MPSWRGAGTDNCCRAYAQTNAQDLMDLLTQDPAAFRPRMASGMAWRLPKSRVGRSEL